MKKNKGLYERFIKRPIDFIFSGLAIVVLSPILVVSAILVRIKLGSPVIFKQARPGKGEKIFYLYKFRSMTNEVDKDGKLLPDSKRLTKFGKFLRKSSIDELPELLNILRGDMSFVGPRPLSIYYLPHYDGASKSRHDVRPGLTGLAQINGRNNLPWEERFAMDTKYVANVTFWGDLKIIFGTFFKVLKAADVSVRGTTKVYDYGVHKQMQEEGTSTFLKHYETTYSELGSYFWLDKSSIPEKAQRIEFLPKMSDETFVFSGRAAIEVVLQDALKRKAIKKVYVPSYCCVAMLQAFIDNDVTYEFYDVSIEHGKIHYGIDAEKDCDLILYMQYFSMESNDVTEMLMKMQSRGVLVLEDITHSMFDAVPMLPFSDYLIGSLRKWLEVPAGGWVGKREGTLEAKPCVNSDQTILEKVEAMDMKFRYINGEAVDKNIFLQANAKFENDLIHVDKMLMLDEVSLKILSHADMEILKAKRVANVKVLQKGLQDLDVITLPVIDLEKSVPLFYPIFLSTEDRDSLRQYLISCGMYCPVHWPETMGADAGIRANELSLICDQRYSEKDMEALSACIHDWYRQR